MWINTYTLEMFSLHSDIRASLPNTSLPRQLSNTVLSSLGIEPVTVLERPGYNPATQKLTLQTAVNSGGVWSSGWDIIPLSAEEQEVTCENAEDDVRRARNKLLVETDWWAVQDRTMTQAEKNYRQLLRSITEHRNFPHLSEEDWPTQPQGGRL